MKYALQGGKPSGGHVFGAHAVPLKASSIYKLSDTLGASVLLPVSDLAYKLTVL